MQRESKFSSFKEEKEFLNVYDTKSYILGCIFVSLYFL